MRKLAILTFVTIGGVMQALSNPEEERSGGFTRGGWARDCCDEVMVTHNRYSQIVICASVTHITDFSGFVECKTKSCPAGE